MWYFWDIQGSSAAIPFGCGRRKKNEEGSMRLNQLVLLSSAILLALTVVVPAYAFEKPKAAFPAALPKVIPAAPVRKTTGSPQSIHPAMVDALSGKRTTTQRSKPSSLSSATQPQPQRYHVKSHYQRRGLTKLEPVGMPTAGITHHWIAPLPDSSHNYLQDMYKH